MSLSRSLTLVLAAIVALSSAALAAPGYLDPTFDFDGIAVFGPGEQHDSGRDVVTLPDRSTVVCGTASYHLAYRGFVIRILEDGSQDGGFGDLGTTILAHGTGTYPYSMLALPDGKLLVAGVVEFSTDAEFFVARLHPEGRLDETFGSAGYAVTAYSPSNEYCYGLGVQADGKIVLAGTTDNGVYNSLMFARFSAEGVLDTDFGNGGYATITSSIQYEDIQDVAFLSDGSIVGIGGAYQSTPIWWLQVILAKLDADGVPVADFGTGGVVVVPVRHLEPSHGYAITEDNDELFLTGYVYDESSNFELFVAKADADGDLDASFGTDGGYSTLGIDSYEIGFDMLLQPDGKICIAGTSGGGGSNPRDILVARFGQDGLLDTTFGGTGYVTTEVYTSSDEAHGIGMQPDGKLVVAGTTADAMTDNDVAVVRYLNEGMAGIDDEDDTSAPPTLGLSVWPNPAAGSTSVAYYLPDRRHVRVAVYDVSGRLVAEVCDETVDGGDHVVAWDGRDGRGVAVPSGVYWCKLTAGRDVSTTSLTVLR